MALKAEQDRAAEIRGKWSRALRELREARIAWMRDPRDALTERNHREAALAVGILLQEARALGVELEPRPLQYLWHARRTRHAGDLVLAALFGLSAVALVWDALSRHGWVVWVPLALLAIIGAWLVGRERP